MALAFARAGMNAVIADIDADAAEGVRLEVEALGVRAIAQRVDVVERDALEALAERVWDEFGGAHVLCNNAGVTTFGLLCEGEISEADWRWVLSVNLQGVIHGLQVFLPLMRELPGQKHVVNTASTAGLIGSPLVAPYVATKHGVLGLSDTLRMEGAAHQISCSVLCPSSVNTRIVESERNRHASYGGARGVSNEMVAAHVRNTGIDPLWVGEMVRQAVVDDVPYIFTHADTRESVDARYQAMLDSFGWADRWREEHGSGD
jgi:NAD(P)-dependent dehydrogenase (short-subunit alcohol dehydrogenase family)